MKPVLIAPDLDKEFRVEVDILNYITKRVLLIKCSNKLQRPVAFISKSLNDIEKNYKIHNKEMLAVVKCLKVQKCKETILSYTPNTLIVIYQSDLVLIK